MKTLNLTRHDLEERIARFDKLQPMSTAKDLALSQEASGDLRRDRRQESIETLARGCVCSTP